MAQQIQQKLIEEEMKDAYVDYAMSVIVGRALPDVRDGLKPVHRRILYSMHQNGLLHNKPFRKSARIVGDVLGKYHPHGDSAVYDALVRLAQHWSLRYPLIFGQGNFGSVDGDSPAAQRYCITGDSLIVTEKGLVPIESLSNKEKIDIKILSKDKKIHKASKWFDSDEHPTIKLTTNKGYSITGSHNHPLLMLTKDEFERPKFEWKLLENIKEGDFVVIDRSNDKLWPKNKLNLKKYFPQLKNKRIKKRILPNYLDRDLAFILGALVSEGSLTEKKIEFCNSDEKWINSFEEIWNKIFPDSVLHKFKRKPSSYGKKDYYRLECHYLYTIDFLKNIGLVLDKSEKRQIPFTILQSPKDIESSFLKSYFEGDGNINYFSKKRSLDLGCCSKSETLINQIQILLLRFGIDSFKRADRDCWKIFIRGKRNVLRFYKEIRFLFDRKNKTLEYGLIKYQKESSLTDFVPHLSNYIRNQTNSEFLIKNNFDRYGNMEKNYERVSSILLQKTGIDHSSMFEYLLTYNYLFEPVVKVENAGIQKVYSIKVESNCHSFISNGFISHNTEARMSAIAEQILLDIEKNTVDFAPNYDGSTQEPTVLPAKLPNLLINGSSGIAVGMATNMPPHNFAEISDAIIATINDPEIDINRLIQIVPGPDFPTGGYICGKNGIKSAYLTGKGRLILRAKAEIQETKNKKRIIISEIPYQVNKSLLIENIANLVKDKRIEGISDIRDESDRKGMQIVIEIRKSHDENIILNQLYKHSNLQTTFGVINLALVNNEPKILNLKEIIQNYISHRKVVVTRRTKFELKKAEQRYHILEGLSIALKNIDEAVSLIKKSKDPQEAKQQLTKKFKLTEIQSQAILDMRLQKLTSLEQNKIKEELESLIKLIKELKEILASEQKILEIIKKELIEIRDKFSDSRRTEILDIEEEIETADLIPEDDVVITMTYSGYIKQIPLETYRQQKRGGKGVKGTETKEDDIVKQLFITSNHNTLLFFTNKGKVHALKAYQIPQGSRYAKGKAIINLLNLPETERITTIVPISSFDKNHFLIMATKKGLIKKTSLDAYSKPRKGGVIGINLKEDDELVEARLTPGILKFMIATKKGMAVKFDEKAIRAIGRTATGVRGIRLKKDDEVIGLEVALDNAYLLTITEKGQGKKTIISEYRLINRGGKGVINMKINKKTGNVIGIKTMKDDDEIIIMTENGIVIRTSASNISSIGRNTSGVKVIRLNDNDKVTTLARVVQKNGNSN